MALILVLISGHVKSYELTLAVASASWLALHLTPMTKLLILLYILLRRNRVKVMVIRLRALR